MLSIREVEAAIKGSWLLFLNRDEGLKWFDLSVAGFWRSFSVIFLLLPLFWITGLAEKHLILNETALTPETFEGATFWISRLLGLGLDWIALPLLLAGLAKPLGISGGYSAFVSVRNWTSLFVSIPYVLTALLFLGGAIPGGIMYLIWLCLLVMILWYRFHITRLIFQSSLGLTISIVTLDFVLSVFIQTVIERFFAA